MQKILGGNAQCSKITPSFFHGLLHLMPKLPVSMIK